MNASLEPHPLLVGDRLLYACVGASMLLHAFALLTAAPAPPKETPPLRLTATLRALEPAPAPAPPPAPASSVVPEPQKATAPEPQKVPPKPVPEVRRTEPRPQAAPAPEQRLVKPLPEERSEARPAPTIAAQPSVPAPAPAPAAVAPAEAKSEAKADAPRIASAAPSTAAGAGTSGSSEDVKLAVGLFQDKLVSIIETRRYKRYPNEAMQNGWEGIAWVELLVGSDGKTRGINVHKSSGHEMLDREARVAVEKARVEAMMQIPPALKGREFVAQIRVVFKLP
ncbi:MAG: energy transducer TonB [Burkholderiales bacterium]|nr:energy transducer TonB [Burkholderiales bacterium]